MIIHSDCETIIFHRRFGFFIGGGGGESYLTISIFIPINIC